MNITELYNKWRSSKNHSLDLDYLLGNIPNTQQSIEEKMIWLQEIINWVRKPGLVAKASSLLDSSSQSLRLKFLLHKLQINEVTQTQFVEVFFQIFTKTDTISLMTNIGLVDQDSFFLDLSKRIQNKILPQAPDYKNLAYLISSNFESISDYQFLSEMDESQIAFIHQMFAPKSEELQKYFALQICESILLISAQVSGLAVHTDIRRRMRPHQLEENPFFQLEDLIRDLHKVQKQENSITVTEDYARNILRYHVICMDYLRDVHIYLETYGVDTNIVYKVEKMEGQLNRIEQLLSLLQNRESSAKQIFNFIQNLVVESVRQRSVLSLTKDSLALLSRKITERSAETGEHYIARDSSEFLYLLKKALGGGAFTSITVLFKFLSAYFPLSGMGLGLLSSFNYCFSFLSIQAFGFTLATKQPAMTAPSLAEKMQSLEQDKNLQQLCDEIILLVRSQFIAVFGNIMAVIPFSLMFHYIFVFSFGSGIISDEKAFKTIESFSFLGMTPFYAAFTGVLLFSSSLVAGWFDNWFAYHQLEYALSANRKLCFILGETSAKQFAQFWKKNIAGISSNISLGLMLGLIPVLGDFLLLPLDVRHVTLSTGALSISAAQIGINVVSSFEFWFAVMGVVSMSFLNLGVSFSLAMFVAIRAKRLNAPRRGKIYLALLARWKKNPLVFFVPPRNKNI